MVLVKQPVLSVTVMKKYFTLLMVLMLFSVIANGQNYKKYYRAGNEFMKMNKYEDAIAQYTKAIEVEPTEADLYIARGNAYERTRNNFV